MINEKKYSPLPGFGDRRKDNTTIVKRALEEPIRQIVVNAGVEGADAQRFNAATEEYMDMIEAGIIDPTKVTRTALQNAASIAGLMITTECVIADKPEDDKKMGGGMPGGMGAWAAWAAATCTKPANGRGRTSRPSPSAVAAGQHGRPIT